MSPAADPVSPPATEGLEQAARMAARLGIAIAAPPALVRNWRRDMSFGCRIYLSHPSWRYLDRGPMALRTIARLCHARLARGAPNELVRNPCTSPPLLGTTGGVLRLAARPCRCRGVPSGC